MSRPKGVQEKMDRALNSWRTLAPEKTFGGMTLADCEAACAPSVAARARIASLQDQLTEAMADRDAADVVTLSKLQLAGFGVLADPTEGPDSPLVEAFGYTRKSERKTGLTRKKKDPDKK
jgi:hypothetical protein